MSKHDSWCWWRWISRSAETQWTERLTHAADSSWLVIEQPNRRQLLLEVHFKDRHAATALANEWPGRVRRVVAVPPVPGKPVRIAGTFSIGHGPRRGKGNDLEIPYGMAFGSGEHPTTLMLLREMVHETDWASKVVLDVGTGSGILALAARKLGARDIRGLDSDPDAVRVARENEKLNFSRPAIRWETGNAKRLSPALKCDLLTANLFSEVLIQIAPRLARALRPEGELWWKRRASPSTNRGCPGLSGDRPRANRHQNPGPLGHAAVEKALAEGGWIDEDREDEIADRHQRKDRKGGQNQWPDSALTSADLFLDG